MFKINKCTPPDCIKPTFKTNADTHNYDPRGNMQKNKHKTFVRSVYLWNIIIENLDMKFRTCKYTAFSFKLSSFYLIRLLFEIRIVQYCLFLYLFYNILNLDYIRTRIRITLFSVTTNNSSM